MMERDQLTTLANFWSEDGNAVSFYYAPQRPENLAHQKTVISAKEQAREVLHAGKDRPALRPIVERLMERAEALRETDPAGLAIFAAPGSGSTAGTWVEIDLPFPGVSKAQLGNSFAIAPLASSTEKLPHYFVLLLDRSVTRLLVLAGTELTEQTKDFGEERFPVRETGASRKKSDERSKDDDAFHHLREVGNRLLRRLEAEKVDGVYVGCRNELWPEIEKAMPDVVVQQIIDHFQCDPGLATVEDIAGLVLPMVEEGTARELQALADQVQGAAAGNRKGAEGPEAVANAVEMGEAEMVLMAPHDPVPATVCTSCEHIGIGSTSVCELCGQPNRIYPDLSEVIARRSGFEMRQVPHGMLAAGANGFSALLRFKATQQDSGSHSALVA